MEPIINEQSASLTIRRFVEEDAGDYTIRLKNSCGVVETYVTVIFLSKFGNFLTICKEFILILFCRTTIETWNTRTS